MSPSVRCEGPTFEFPGRGGGRRGAGGSGRERPGPLPAPHQAEESGPQFPQFLYLVQLRGSVIKFPPASPATASVLREHPATLAAQLRGCLVSKSGSPAELASPTWTPFSQGTAEPCLTGPLFLQALWACRQGVSPQRAFRAARKQPSRLLVQRVSVSIPQGAPCCPPHPAPIAPSSQACGHKPHPSWQRSHRISDVAVVLQFHNQCT